MIIALDTETTGLDAHKGARMFSFSTCTEDGNIRVYRLEGKRKGQYEKYLRDILYSGKHEVVFHNANFDLTMIAHTMGWRDVHRVVKFHDTYIQSWFFLPEHRTRGLKDLCFDLCGFKIDNDKRVRQIAKKTESYANVPSWVLNEYQANDAFRTMLLHKFFYPRIEHAAFKSIYDLELDLIRATIDMQNRGVMIHSGRCESLITFLKNEISDIEKRVQERTGRKVNLRKPSDLRWMLYEFGKLPVLSLTKKTSQASTDKETLFALRDLEPSDLLENVLKFRSYDRGISTIKSYLDAKDSSDVIHPSINSCAAITGRESCSRPNLQNVAKSTTLMNAYPIPVRKVFRHRPKTINVHIDYASIELRLLVFYSREQELIDCIARGGDPHALAAEVFFGKSFLNLEGADRKAKRDAAKNANFAIAYGAGASRLQDILGLSVDHALDAYVRYASRWPKLCSLVRTLSRKAIDEGKITSVFGTSIPIQKEKAYVATNYLIQHTAAVILKYAQCRVDALFRRWEFENCYLLLPIHDEIIMQWSRDRLPFLKQCLREIRQAMIDFPMFDVPVEIEISLATHDWERKEKYDL